jgi:hypothetical protein
MKEFDREISRYLKLEKESEDKKNTKLRIVIEKVNDERYRLTLDKNSICKYRLDFSHIVYLNEITKKLIQDYDGDYFG